MPITMAKNVTGKCSSRLCVAGDTAFACVMSVMV